MDLEVIVNVCQCVLGCCTSCEEVQDEALLAELEAMRLRLGQLERELSRALENSTGFQADGCCTARSGKL